MAEEKNPIEQIFDGFTEDMTAVGELLLHVRGSSPISIAPLLDPVLADETDYGEQYQFE